MLAIAVALSALVGLSLGMLGGGGSILTVPILVYVLRVPAKEAIALSLLVVGGTSLAALVPHARAGRVRFRAALVFGAAGMVGAFAGGRVARHIPGEWLLLAFSVVMVVTAAAMLRGRRDPGAAGKLPSHGRLLALGGAVGFFSGLVGAGGGFLIVPALALFGGMEMCCAVGTSLAVIAMNSLAGFAGHLEHAHVDWSLALLVTGSAIAGSVVGARLAGRIPERVLRQVFGWLVLAMGVYMLATQMPASVQASAAWHAIFVARWPAWVGGLAIGGFVLAFLLVDNKLLGVSTGCAELCRPRDAAVWRSWRPPFLLGIVIGGVIAAVLGGARPSLAMGALDAMVAAVPAVKLPLLVGAGVLIGYGARRAGGCTSGHAIVGVAQGARSSLIAAALFMVSGFVTTQILKGLLG